MTDHGELEYGAATGNDYPSHERQYETFVLIAAMGICHVVCIVLGLVIGTILGHWVIMVGIFIAATVAAIYGLATGVRIPAAIIVLISLVLMAVYAM